MGAKLFLAGILPQKEQAIRNFLLKKCNHRFVITPNPRKFVDNYKKMTEKKNYTERQERIARFAKALGHPARIAIMEFLAKQQTCYFGAIHEELPISKATVSQHLKELKDAGLIQGELETPKVKYCINQDNWLLAKSLFKDFLETKLNKKNCCQ